MYAVFQSKKLSKEETIKQLVQKTDPSNLNLYKKVDISPCNLSAEIMENVIPNFCFDNMAILTSFFPDCSIVFGYYFYPNNGGVLIDHAWLKLADGTYVDPTYHKGKVDSHIEISDGEHLSLYEIPAQDYKKINKTIYHPSLQDIVGFNLRMLMKLSNIRQFRSVKNKESKLKKAS